MTFNKRSFDELQKKSRKHMTLYNLARNDDTRMKKSSETDLRVQEIMLIADSS